VGLTVAIIGAGPAGFYTAEALITAAPDVTIDLIERLPTPFGLIRAGVAPDHQSTKKVTRAFDRTAQHDRVSYFGNVEVGKDVLIPELLELYDAVVLSVGAPGDRPLGIPGEEKRGVLGSASFVGWYNGHPDFRDLHPPLDTATAVVIGNGNVAVDVARVLVKTPAEMIATDLATHAAEQINASPLRDVHLIGRRGPVEAKFTNVELRELGELADASPVVDVTDLPDHVPADLPDREKRLKERNLSTLRDFAAHTEDKTKHIHFHFYARPVEILGGDRVEGVRFETTDPAHPSGSLTIPCGLVIAAIGYAAVPLADVPFDLANGHTVNVEGRISPRLYAAGWAMRGPTGVIGTNKADGDLIAHHIIADVGSETNRPTTNRPGRSGFMKLLADRKVTPVTFQDWQAIDAAEIAAAPDGAPRRKFTRIKEMLEALNQPGRHQP